MIRPVSLFLVLLLASACSKNDGATTTEAAGATPAANGAPAQAEPAKPVPAQLPDVVARVNGEAITKGEFERAISSLEGRAGGPVPGEQRDRIFRGVLEELIGYRLLTQEAKARNISIADADVESRINEIRQQFPSEEVFTQMLAQRNVTIEQLRNDARQDMAIARIIESEIAAKIGVTPAQIDDFYKKNPDQFQQPERVRASHILITAAKDADAKTRADAKARAEQILKDVKAGKDFAALAKQHSQDPGSASQGGDLGYFQQGQMVGPFNDAAFSLKPGTTSELIETDFGYHIIKVQDKQASRTVPLEEVRPQLEQYLQNQNRQQQTTAFVQGLRAKAKVEVLM